MRFSRLVSQQADCQSSHFSLRIGGTRSHDVSRVYQSLQNWLLVIPSRWPQPEKIVNRNTSVKLFILEYINITCPIQVVHRIQGWMEEKLQTYFKRDTECLNHNMWIISCMIISYYCFLMAFIVQQYLCRFLFEFHVRLKINPSLLIEPA